MDTSPAELSLFEEPVISAPFQKVQYIEYRSPSALNDAGPLQFFLVPSANQFIDLKRCKLHVKAKIVDETGKKADADADVTPVNLTLQSMFESVEVYLQQQLVSSHQLYPYKAYVETILDTDAGAQNSFLQSQHFYKDDSGLAADSGAGEQNDGLTTRWAKWKAGKSVTLEGPIMADVCQQDRFILNGVEILIKLWPSKAAFSLLTPKTEKTHRIHLEEVYLSVCKITPTPSITNGIMESLKDKQALYPYIRTELRSFQLKAGDYSFHWEDVYQKTVPSEIVIGFVHADAFNGSIAKNPFNFEHYDLAEIGVYIDDESFPARPLQLDFASGDYISAYNTLFSNNPDKSLNITRADYDSGYSLIRFRLVPEQAEASPPNKGNVKVNGRFKVPLPNNVTAVLIAKFNSLLTINEERSVTI
jgi:hypothetical protein